MYWNERAAYMHCNMLKGYSHSDIHALLIFILLIFGQ